MAIDDRILSHGDVVAELGEAGVFDDASDKRVVSDLHAEETEVGSFRATEREDLEEFPERGVDDDDEYPFACVLVTYRVLVGPWLVGDVEQPYDAAGNQQLRDEEQKSAEEGEEREEDEMPYGGK